MSQPLTLSEVQFTQFLTYLDAPQARSVVEQWQPFLPSRGGHELSRRFHIPAEETVVDFQFEVARDGKTPVAGELWVSRKHDALALLREFRVFGAVTLNEAAGLCQSLLLGPRPPDGYLGQTTVLIAQPTEATSTRQLAEQLLTALGAGVGPIQGGVLQPGVELFSGSDPTWLVLLIKDKDQEKAAGQLLNTTLWFVEMSFHKILGQQKEYGRICGEGGRLFQQSQSLREELDRLAAREQSDDIGDRLDRATRAYGELIKTVEWVRKTQVTLETNRANLLRYLPDLGQESGLAALVGRRQRADLAIGQARTDLGYLQPLLEYGRWVIGSLQTQKLIVIGQAESQAAAQRETDRRQAEEEGEWLKRHIDVAVIWLTFAQFWGLALTAYFAEEVARPGETTWARFWQIWLLMWLPPTLLGVVLIFFGLRLWRGWTRNKRRNPSHSP
jgi:hypothetical protein